MSPIYRLQGTEKSTFVVICIDLKGDSMKGLPSAMFWINSSVYTSNFVYPTSFGY
ncbi:hypothetical protein GCM10026988_23040 [Vibrio panuliri]